MKHFTLLRLTKFKYQPNDNTIYDLYLQSVSWYLQLQLIADDHHGNTFPIPSMNNPNRTRTQNFGFFPISSVSKGKYVLLIKVINCKVQGSKKLECWTYRVVRKTDMCSRFDTSG